MTVERWERQEDKTVAMGQRVRLSSDIERAFLIVDGEGTVLMIERLGEKIKHGPLRPVSTGDVIKVRKSLEALLSNYRAAPLVYCDVPIVKLGAEHPK